MKHFKVIRKGVAGSFPETTIIVGENAFPITHAGYFSKAICDLTDYSGYGLKGYSYPTRFYRGDAFVELNLDQMDLIEMSTKEIGTLLYQRALLVDNAFNEKYPQIDEEWSSETMTKKRKK